MSDTVEVPRERLTALVDWTNAAAMYLRDEGVKNLADEAQGDAEAARAILDAPKPASSIADPEVRQRYAEYIGRNS